MGVEQIKHHPFFYGVNWNAIRQIDAPFIPRLKSITDTSYFPTDELEQVPDEPVGGDVANASKDLAFLGCVPLSFLRELNVAHLSAHDSGRQRFSGFSRQFSLTVIFVLPGFYSITLSIYL